MDRIPAGNVLAFHASFRQTRLPELVMVILCLVGSEVTRAEQPVDYLRQVKPLLTERCYACHGALKESGGLRLDTAASARLGGDSGEVIISGNPDDSLLIGVVTGDAGYQMPPEGEGPELTDEQIEILRRWIAEGATGPDDELPQEDPHQYWSYRDIERPDVPVVPRQDWVRNPVDAFIAHEHEQHGLTASLEADRPTLLRRIYLDLIGIPPTPEQLDEFLADRREDAYERVVEQLLHSPLYGQRWGRHWMDVWRYSDWYGSRGINQIRYGQRHAWRWRDWIVESLNENKGYDQLIREMLAGDEIAPGDPNIVRATGFLGRNWYKFDRDVWMFDTVEHTAQAFLGLTLRCCRCHDHKFDPISQVDYYRFRAFFEPHDVRTDPISANLATEMDTGAPVLAEGVSLVYDKQLDVPTYLFQRGDSRFPDESRPLKPGVPAALGGSLPPINPVTLPVAGFYPMLREELVAARQEELDANVVDADQKVERHQALVETFQRRLVQASDSTEPTESAAQTAVELADDPGADNRETIERQLAAALRQVGLSRRRLAQAQAERNWFLAVVRAERAKEDAAGESDCDEVQVTAREAGEAERLWNLAKAELADDRARDELQLAKEKSLPDEAAREKAIQQARRQAETAQVELDKARREWEQPADRATYTALGPRYSRMSSGRRTALADWLVSPENRRTARVAVNHLWLRHFGEGIVPTAANFGLSGQAASHPELLDWLASELIDNGWSLKHVHRLMVLSSSYRMATGAVVAEENSVRDPDNRWLWRMNSRRLESEAIRDSVLHVAGQLDITPGGPEIPESQGMDSFRRSMYFRGTPNEQMQFLELFDQANPNECYRRQESVIPQQALALSNSPLALNSARQLAGQLLDEKQDRDEEAVTRDRFVAAAFRYILTRAPSPKEAEACYRFLERQSKLFELEAGTPYPDVKGNISPPAESSEQRARENLVHVLLNHNDFVTIR